MASIMDGINASLFPTLDQTVGMAVGMSKADEIKAGTEKVQLEIDALQRQEVKALAEDLKKLELEGAPAEAIKAIKSLMAAQEKKAALRAARAA